jgi:hypothetical protein
MKIRRFERDFIGIEKQGFLMCRDFWRENDLMGDVTDLGIF